MPLGLFVSRDPKPLVYSPQKVLLNCLGNRWLNIESLGTMSFYLLYHLAFSCCFSQLPPALILSLSCRGSVVPTFFSDDSSLPSFSFKNIIIFFLLLLRRSILFREFPSTEGLKVIPMFTLTFTFSCHFILFHSNSL